MSQSWVTAVFINSFAIIILLILLIDSRRKQHRFVLKDQALFQWMLVVNILILILDAFTWVLNGQNFPGARTLNLLFTTTYYICNPVMSLLYICYCEIKIGTASGRRKRLALLYSVPLVFNLILSVISIRRGLLFNIGSDNVYTRGSALAVSFFLSYVLMLIASVRVHLHLRNLRKAARRYPPPFHRRRLTVLLLFPLLGGSLQILNIPVTVVWLSTVVALLVIYINIQNSEITTDALTGLYNRRQTDAYLQSLFQRCEKGNPIHLAILDVDNFKQINDRYGHLTGDNALRTLAGVLQEECGRNTFYSRYGGDEFVIVTRNGGKEDLDILLARINQRLNEYCRLLEVPYRLSVSAGIAPWSGRPESIDALFATADAELYRNKTKLSRRITDQQRAPETELA
ncbi:MAG: GGDEF domain-containing protein [Eubacteriales bacterium]|nr:GGDEF domain-containing protein [Eubacteriales bacterium]